MLGTARAVTHHHWLPTSSAEAAALAPNTLPISQQPPQPISLVGLQGCWWWEWWGGLNEIYHWMRWGEESRGTRRPWVRKGRERRERRQWELWAAWHSTTAPCHCQGCQHNSRLRGHAVEMRSGQDGRGEEGSISNSLLTSQRSSGDKTPYFSSL